MAKKKGKKKVKVGEKERSRGMIVKGFSERIAQVMKTKIKCQECEG